MASKHNMNRFAVVIEPDQVNEETDFVKFRPKITAYSSNTNRQSRISVLNQRFRQSIAFVHGALDDGVLSFITIKVLLWDLAISIGVLIFDFLQGFIKWCLNSSIGGFHVVAKVIRELKSHMIPYKFKCSHWWKIALQCKSYNFNQ